MKCERMRNLVRIIGDGLSSDDPLPTAAGVWKCWPMLAGVIRTAVKHDGADESETPKLIGELRSLHATAETVIATFAESIGVDSSPIYAAGRVARDQIAKPMNRQTGTYLTWPDCLGEKRHELPRPMLDAIDAGDAFFKRLSVLSESPQLGISLRDVAEAYTDGNKDATAKTIKRWLNQPRPKPIGKCPKKKQADLYKPSEILAFAKKLECELSPEKRREVEEKARAPRA